MKRFFLDTLPHEDFTLQGEESHHLNRVLRCKAGEIVEGLDGKGLVHTYRIEAMDRRGTVLSFLERDLHTPNAHPTHLILAFPQSRQTLSTLLPMLCQLGIDHLTLFPSSYGGPPPRDLDGLLSRLYQVACQSLKQSGNPFLPSIQWSEGWKEALNIHDFGGLTWFTDPEGSLWRDLWPSEQPNGLQLLIGPEGGFSTEEIQAFKNKDLSSLALGPHVLRLETAALTACALAMAKLRGDL
jgi:16S rRNA (uracil1498-N3)-methyltransferase